MVQTAHTQKYFDNCPPFSSNLKKLVLKSDFMIFSTLLLLSMWGTYSNVGSRQECQSRDSNHVRGFTVVTLAKFQEL